MRPTYTDLQDRVTRLSRSENLLHTALNCALHERPNAVERFKGTTPGERYVLRLYRATGVSGGIVVETFHFKQQRPQARVHYLDEMPEYARTHLQEMATAVTRLFAARNGLLAPTTTPQAGVHP